MRSSISRELAILQMQVHTGILPAEVADHAGEDVDPGRRAGADHEGATLEALQFPDGLARAVQRAEHAQRVGLEETAGLGEGDASSKPVEHLHLELALQLADVLRERGLAGVQGVGGTAIAPGPRHGQEDLQLPERHAGSIGLSIG